MFTSPASIDRGKLKLADRRLEFQTPQRNLEDLRVDVGEETGVQKAEMGLQSNSSNANANEDVGGEPGNIRKSKNCC